MRKVIAQETHHQGETSTVFQRFWHWCTAPSSKIQEPDQRRQATLLSALLLVLIVVGVVAEGITILMINRPDYTGYRDTFLGLGVIALVYAVSRTQYVRLAAILAVAVILSAIFGTGGSLPYSVMGGFFDYLILPLWLGSIYLNLKELGLLLAFEVLGLLIFPVLVPAVTINDILIGPFSFVLVLSILLITLTRHRNLLEQDRRAELVEKEQRSRHEAARAEALLRMAGRLNAQLNLDALLEAISEEATRALGAPVSLVTLYDKKQNIFYTATAVGIESDVLKSMQPFPRALYDETVRGYGKVFSLPNLQAFPQLPNLELFKDFRALAFATMEYEGELIGSLTAITLDENRAFTEDELLLLQGMADQAALAIINTRLYKDARRRLEHLQALRAIDIAISSNHDLQKTLDVLLEQIISQLGIDAAVILLLDEAKEQLEFGSSRGFQTSTLRYTSLRIGQGMAGRAAQECRVVHVADLRVDPQSLVNASSLMQEGFVSYYAAPLMSQGKVKGVLEIFHRSRLDPDEEWLNFLETLAGQAAIAVESTTLFEDLQRSNNELIAAYDATIEGWSHALDLRDKETEGHTLRVTELTIELARAFNYDEKQLQYIRWGALLHDIGKLGVADRILFKEAHLTEEEWHSMQQHPVHAYDMLRSIEYLQPALNIPYCHHEKWDGTGYPRRLKGEEIPLEARIFAVVDVWDALTSDRPYRAAWSAEKTLIHIQQGSGAHFDPVIVEAFVHLIQKKLKP